MVLLVGDVRALGASRPRVYLAVARSVELGHQHDRRPLPGGPHQLRRGAARRSRLDRHVRRRGGLRRHAGSAPPGSAAVSYLIMLRFVLYVPITVVGFVVLVTRYGGWSKLRAALRTERSTVTRASRPRGPAAAAPRPARSPPPSRVRRRGAVAQHPRGCGCPPHNSACCARGRSRPRPGRLSPGRTGRRRALRDRHGVQMAWIIAGCLALAAITPAVPVHAHVRPVGLDPLGPRDRPPRPGNRGRPVVEAAPDPVHHAVLALRRRSRSLPVAVGRARRRAARVRDGLPRRAAGWSAGASTACSPACPAFAALFAEQQVRPRRRARQLGAAARRGRAVGLRAAPRRPP